MALREYYINEINRAGGREKMITSLKRLSNKYRKDKTYHFDSCIAYINSLYLDPERSVENDLEAYPDLALKCIEYVQAKAKAENCAMLGVLSKIMDRLTNHIKGLNGLLQVV